jgi:hypothetical protein
MKISIGTPPGPHGRLEVLVGVVGFEPTTLTSQRSGSGR